VDEHQGGHDHEHASGCCGGSGKASEPGAATTVTDPVCGMKVNPATSRHRFDHTGTTHHFCSAGCRTKFAADPDAYLRPKVTAPAPAAPGAIYTCPMHPQIRQRCPRSHLADVRGLVVLGTSAVAVLGPDCGRFGRHHRLPLRARTGYADVDRYGRRQGSRCGHPHQVGREAGALGEGHYPESCALSARSVPDLPSVTRLL
jgi:YHS domain-containing protein